MNETKIYIYPIFKNLLDYLEKGINKKTPPICICGYRYIIKEYKEKDIYKIRVWKSYCFFDFWYTDYDNINKNEYLLGVLDFEINNNIIGIRKLEVNSKDMKPIKSKKLKKALFSHIFKFNTNKITYLI